MVSKTKKSVSKKTKNSNMRNIKNAGKATLNKKSKNTNTMNMLNSVKMGKKRSLMRGGINPFIIDNNVVEEENIVTTGIILKNAENRIIPPGNIIQPPNIGTMVSPNIIGTTPQISNANRAIINASERKTALNKLIASRIKKPNQIILAKDVFGNYINFNTLRAKSPKIADKNRNKGYITISTTADKPSITKRIANWTRKAATSVSPRTLIAQTHSALFPRKNPQPRPPPKKNPTNVAPPPKIKF